MPTTHIILICQNPSCRKQERKAWRPGRPQPQYCSQRCWYAHRSQLGPLWRKYHWSDDELARLREACRRYGGMKAAWEAGQFGNKPYAIVKREAKRLGIVRRTHDDLWTVDEELVLLRLAAEGRALEVMRRKLATIGSWRSIEAIAQRLRELGYRGRRGRYTLTDIAECLESDVHRVRSWVDRGWLRATPTSQGPGAWWYVTVADLRAFLVEHRLDVAQGDMRLAWALSLFEYARADGDQE
jgi:hypothetical protein